MHVLLGEVAAIDPSNRRLALTDGEWLRTACLTLLGSVANLIVAESAARSGCKIGSVESLKVGVPLTFATTAAGVAWLSWS